MFQWIMGNLPGTKQPLLHASVAVLAFIAVPAFSAGLNDTGITDCGDASSTSWSNCAKVAADDNSFPRQDARYGRDPQNELGMLPKPDGGGSTGFDFSRVTNDGTVNNAAQLGPGANDWACTRDNVTGLTWEVKTTSGLRDKSHTYTLYQGGVGVPDGGTCSGGTGCDTTKFVDDVNASKLCGDIGWRLPTLKELENIVDFSRINPPIDPDYFRNTAVDQYWSSTADSSYAAGQYYWLVDFFTGAAGRSQPLNAQSVRLVRGTATLTNQFTVATDGLTVTDSSTGLVWKRDYEMRDPANPGIWPEVKDLFSWSEALQRPFVASNDNFAGYSDWRLPNVKELRSLISETRHDPAIDTNAFPAMPYQSSFWSASPANDFNKYPDLTWTVGFDIGGTLPKPRWFVENVRLVRGGDSFDNLNSSISLSTSLLNFDPQIVLTPSGTRVVTLSNYGKVPIGNIAISTPASDYSSTDTCTATLAVAQSCSISVTFKPTVEGVRADTITISSDASNRPLNLNLAGTGAASEYALTVTKTGTGLGTVNCGSTLCSATYPTNTDVTLTATADTGSTFTGWSGSGCSGTGICTVRMSQARTVTASFSDNSIVNYSLTVSRVGTGSGTVGPSTVNCADTICSATYSNGAEVTLTAIASGSSTFTGWTGENCTGTSNPCIVSMTKARAVTAIFTAPTAIFTAPTAIFTAPTASGYSLTVSRAGTGSGTVGPANLNCANTICSATYLSGTNVTLTATAASGSTFTGWTGENCTGTSNSCIVSMTKARAVTANFTLAPVVPAAALYDGIYLWAKGEYLSLHQQPANTLVATIYRVHTSDTLTVGTLSIPATDTFDLLNVGTISGATATISGTGFFRACKLSYKLQLNDDSSLTVTRTDVSNTTGVSVAEVDCAAKFTPVGTTWTIRREF